MDLYLRKGEANQNTVRKQLTVSQKIGIIY